MTTPAPAPSVPRIFVSHSHADNEFGVRLVTALRAALGGDEDSVWFDVSGGLHGGDTIFRKIVQEITDRPIFIVVASPQAMASRWVMKEIDFASTLQLTRPNRHIIPVLYEACDLPADLDSRLYVSFLPPQTFEAGLAALVTAVHALAGTRPAPIGATSDQRPPALPPSQPVPAPPADPNAALVARLLPGIRDAYNQRNWLVVLDKADFLTSSVPAAAIPTEVWRMLGEARAETGDAAGARTALETALTHSPTDTEVLFLAARACLLAGDPSAAIPHFKRGLALADAPGERLTLLRGYAAALSALKQWDELQRRTDEGSRLAPDDVYWPRTRLRALTETHRDADALALLRTLTARPDATAADWLARARMAHVVEGESDAATAEITAALDAAARLAGASDPAIGQARRDLFPPPIAPEQYPERFGTQLGFIPRAAKDPKTGKPVAFIIPPTCPVPAGPFQMGKQPGSDPEAQYDGPPRTVDLPAFAIARYPVTVAEYACFVRAGQPEPQKGGYGIEWRTQQTRLDHPVTSVTWHDATAYAAWLARLTDQRWRLPTEEEWEKAARWDPRTGRSRTYPWGDSFDAARCNTSESRIGMTTAIDRYGASGASPCGAWDMAGNVWEWTSSPLDNSTQNRLVLRGGSWNYGHQNARAACRGDGNPGLYNGYFGFRLVLAAPGS